MVNARIPAPTISSTRVKAAFASVNLAKRNHGPLQCLGLPQALIKLQALAILAIAPK